MSQRLKVMLIATLRIPTILHNKTANIIKKQNWNQFLLVVKAAALKQQISKRYSKILSTEASYHICTSHRPVTNVKASFFA